MKIGDLVQDFNGKTWLVYDKSDDSKYLYVTDTETQTVNEYICANIVIEIINKPSNVSWLFLARRKKNLEGLERFL